VAIENVYDVIGSCAKVASCAVVSDFASFHSLNIMMLRMILINRFNSQLTKRNRISC
jgi:hypothetical protein